MKKSFLLLFLLLLVLVTGCKSSRGQVSVAKTDKEFYVDMQKWTDSVEHYIYLQKGEKILVEITNDDSDSLGIKVNNVQSIYTGDNPPSSSFVVTIPETETYTFRVSGEKATGSVHFTVLGFEEENIN